MPLVTSSGELQERPFSVNELFFSTTDIHGVIQFGNHVFERVSGYHESELYGQPHSKIRHPDMPSSVFQLFWETLQKDLSIAAYVKNRAKDGTFYWVMAMACPTPSGFLSIRLKPTSSLFDQVKKIYEAVRSKELEATAEGKSKSIAIAAGRSTLKGELQRIGFSDYFAFMRHALSTEMCSRQLLCANQYIVSEKKLSKASCLYSFASVNEMCRSSLDEMLFHLIDLRAANSQFLTQCKEMLILSNAVSQVAINSRIAADTSVCKAISTLLAASEQDNRAAVLLFNSTVQQVMQELDALAFDVCVAALQTEMTSHFLQELSDNQKPASHHSLFLCDLLLSQSNSSIRHLDERLSTARRYFQSLNRCTDKIGASAKSLRYIRTSAVTESAFLHPSHAFCGIFAEVKDHIRRTQVISEGMQNTLMKSEDSLMRILNIKPTLLSRSQSRELEWSMHGSRNLSEQFTLDRLSLPSLSTWS
jgi:aerotaxis receptor